MTPQAPRYFCATPPQELGRARRGESRWNKRTLRWAIADRLPGVSVEQMTEDYKWAWAQWSAVTPLTFEHIVSVAAADIIVATRAVDNAGGTLALFQLPPGNDQQIRGWFDVGERWNVDVQLRLVALHEFGHAIGLDHIDARHPDKASVMDSIYNPQLTTLQSLDIAAAQKIYGPAKQDPTPSPELPKPKPAPSPPPPDGQIIVTVVTPMGTYGPGTLVRLF